MIRRIRRAETAATAGARRRPLALLLLAFTLAAACAAPAPPPARPAEPPAPTTDSGRLLRQVMDEIWDHQLEQSIFLRQQYGLPVEHLPDLTRAHAVQETALARGWLSRLEAVDEAELTHQETLSLAMLHHELRAQVEGLEFFWFHFPVTPYASPLREVHPALAAFPLKNAADGERYYALAAQYPELIRQMHRHLKRQASKGIRLPKPAIELVMQQFQALAQPLDSGPLALGARKAALGAAAEPLSQRLGELVDGEVNPAIDKLLAYLGGGYFEKAPLEVGLSQYPGGGRYYRFLVRLHTTLDLTPWEVHRMGLEEVDRLETAMTEVREQRLHWTRSKAAFHDYLATNPRFFAHSAEEVGQRLRQAVAAIEPRISWRFSSMPRAPYAVERLSPQLEGGLTYGFYKPPTDDDPRGVYYYNGSQPEKRSLLWARSLMLHELVPGHHFQVALQVENEQLHPLRRNSYATAFVEGWAEYASSLGQELELYELPYDLYGRLAAEMFLAVRLVVDTGMNRQGWSRQEAIDYMREHTLESDVQIATETLRYAVDIPGQALAYKVGALEIAALRRQAAEALGDDFDVKEFHAAVLGSGALPLTVLRRHVEYFIDQHRAGG